MRTYLTWAIILSIVIIPASIATFLSSNISDAIRGDITRANSLAVKLSTELGPPPRTDVGLRDEIADLQEYAATVRLIFATSQFLIHLADERPALATLDFAGSFQPIWHFVIDHPSSHLLDEIEDGFLKFQCHAASKTFYDFKMR
jgi:hypothetical protein